MSNGVVERVRDRAAALAHRRAEKMAASIDAYIRGNTQAFYLWLEALPHDAIPVGPPIWICGDCHVGNLGPLADDRGRVEIQIRDFDQSVIGNPAYDLIRLGLSLASAARGAALPGRMTVKMIEALAAGYEDAFLPAKDGSLKEPRFMKRVVKGALKREWKQLARERTEGLDPTLPCSRKMWPLSAKERHAIKSLFKTSAISELATQLRHREEGGKVSFLDGAYWRKGCSSLGKLRYAVLLDVNGGTLEGDDFCLMDIKEAAPSIAPAAHGARMPRDQGRRVLEGARHLSPALGDRMRSARLLDRSVVIRELMPQDLKLDIAKLREEHAEQWAFFLAQVVGRAHARQLDDVLCKAWHAQLRKRRPRSGQVPSWLWSSVIALLAHHEQSYLTHCHQQIDMTGAR